jgi:hypothetical protein
LQPQKDKNNLMHFENFTFSEEDQLQTPAVMAFDIDRVPMSSK